MNKKDEKIIQVFDLLHVYKGKVETIALSGINLSVSKGERLVIRGKSGVGKTTLLHCLAGILKPTAKMIGKLALKLTKLAAGIGTIVGITKLVELGMKEIKPEKKAENFGAIPQGENYHRDVGWY